MLKRRAFRDGAEEEKKEEPKEKEEFESELEKLLGPKEGEKKIVVAPEDLEPEEKIEIKPEDLPEEEEEVIKVEPEPEPKKPMPPYKPKITPPPVPPPPPPEEEERLPWYSRWWILGPLVGLGAALLVTLMMAIIFGRGGPVKETVSIKMVTPIQGSTMEKVREIVFESSKKVDLEKINVRVLNGQKKVDGTLGGLAGRQFFWDCGTDRLPEGAYQVTVTVQGTKVEPPAEFSFTVGEGEEEKEKEPEITPSADPLDRYRDKTQKPAEDPLDRYR